MIKAMIISVGGTPPPIIKTIRENRPEFVSFYASQATVSVVSQVRDELERSGCTFKSELTLIDNENDLLHCNEKAEDAIKRVRGKGYKKDDVIVDYTGGTKNMSVALALASATEGYSFSYVGGNERTKNGVGIVIDGHEAIFKSVNPWDFFAVNEKYDIALLFNNFQLKAAMEIARQASEKSTRYKTLFKKLGFIIDGYYHWDLLRHDDAIERFKRARIEEISPYDDKSVYSFAMETDKRIPYLKELAGFKGKPSIIYSKDLFANAERRFKEGKIDDAVLRLYRVLEMIAQERLMSQYEIDTSNVLAEKIAIDLKDEYVSKYKDQRDGRIKIPLEACFRLLCALGDDIGKKYKSNESQFRDLQTSRNYSYLTHGFRYSTVNTFQKLKDYVLGFGMIESGGLSEFPLLTIE
jgi:CRISPR-associated protein (TIGR02710 family)